MHRKGRGLVSVSIAPSATFKLLVQVDFDRAETLNMREDERRLERMVISFEIHDYHEGLANKFSLTLP